MYESITSPNDTRSYDFVDYTTPKQSVFAPTTNNFQKDSQIVKKIESVYKSQLLNIEESKEEDIHFEEPERKERG